MERLFPGDPKAERVAIVLGMMSPSMVRDVRDVLAQYGDSLVNAVNTDDSVVTVKPLAIFDSAYIKKPDQLRYIALGLGTAWLDSMSKNKGADHAQGFDEDDYKRMLQSVFRLPGSVAAGYADKIETLDAIGGSAGKDARQSLAGLIVDKVQEWTRRAVNYVPSVLKLPWKMSQDQSFDTDALFEFYQFGKAIEELMTRADLMSAQQKIASGAGLFDTYGAAGDISEDKLAEVVDAFAALNGGVPEAMLGSTKKLREWGDLASAGLVDSVAKSGAVTEQGGLTSDLLSILGSLPFLNTLQSRNRDTAKTLGAKARLLHSAEADRAEAMGDIADEYGDDVAEALQTGDVETLAGLFGEIMDTDSTGDPELDNAIIGEIHDEVMSETGDVAELGGLTTKFRTRARMRKARRRQGRALNKARLHAAKELAKRDYGPEATEFVARDPAYNWAGYGPTADGGGEQQPLDPEGNTSVIDFTGIA